MQVWLWVSHIKLRSISSSHISKQRQVLLHNTYTTYLAVVLKQAKEAVWWWSWWTMLWLETHNSSLLITSPRSQACLGCLQLAQLLTILVWAGAETTRSVLHWTNALTTCNKRQCSSTSHRRRWRYQTSLIQIDLQVAREFKHNSSSNSLVALPRVLPLKSFKPSNSTWHSTKARR